MGWDEDRGVNKRARLVDLRRVEHYVPVRVAIYLIRSTEHDDTVDKGAGVGYVGLFVRRVSKQREGGF